MYVIRVILRISSGHRFSLFRSPFPAGFTALSLVCLFSLALFSFYPVQLADIDSGVI